MKDKYNILYSAQMYTGEVINRPYFGPLAQLVEQWTVNP